MPELKSIVCTEGATLNGYTISADHIRKMAENYDHRRYPARLNLEHIRSLFPDTPFRCFSLINKAEAVTVPDGPLKGKLALEVTAELDEAKDADLIRLNRSGQKIFSSIEWYPEFPDTQSAYLTGVALTDSPAAMGTRQIKLSTAGGSEETHPQYSAALETAVTFTPDTPSQHSENRTEKPDAPAWGEKFLSVIQEKLGLNKKSHTADITELREAITLTAEKCAEALDAGQQTEQLNTMVSEQKHQLATLQQDLTALKTQLSQQDSNPVVRPLSAGFAGGEEPCDY